MRDALTRALSDRGEPLVPPARRRFERAFSVSGPVEETDPGNSGHLGRWQVSATDSPSERAARDMGDRATHARNAELPRSGPELFADVRVHCDGSAAEAAQALTARAFTLGNDIFFADGQYQPDSTTGRRLIAHELTHVLQARSTNSPASPVVMRESWTERAGKWYDEKKWLIYRKIIAGLKSEKNTEVQSARGLVPRFPGWMQGAVSKLIDAGDFIADIIIALILAIIGLAVGFVEGIVGLVTGLIKLAYGLVKLMVDKYLGTLIGKPEAFRDDINTLINAVQNILPGLKQVVDNWLERYKKAPLEEQVLMGGELVGQIEAFIATFALAGTKAGQAAGVGGEAATVRAVGGDVAALERAPALTVVVAKVAKTAAEGAVVSQQMMMMSGQGPGGMPPASLPPSGAGPAPARKAPRPPGKYDEPLTPEEEGLTPEELRRKHIVEDVEGKQEEFRGGAQQEALQEHGMKEAKTPGRAPPVHLERGQLAHQYAELLIKESELPRGLTPEVTAELPGGKVRIDRVNFANGVYYEIKPTTQAAAGAEQIAKYAEYMNKNFPLAGGKRWIGRVVTYETGDAIGLFGF